MKKPEWQEDIAEERIEILFSLAEKELGKHPERSRRYVELARKISLRYNIRMPKELKRTFCKGCNTLFSASGRRVRMDSRTRTMSVKCLNCGRLYRYPYK